MQQQIIPFICLKSHFWYIPGPIQKSYLCSKNHLSWNVLLAPVENYGIKPLLPRYTFGRAVFYIEGIHSHVVPMDDGDKSQTAKVSVPRRNVDDEQRIHFPQGTLFGKRFWGRFDRNIKKAESGRKDSWSKPETHLGNHWMELAGSQRKLKTQKPSKWQKITIPFPSQTHLFHNNYTVFLQHLYQTTKPKRSTWRYSNGFQPSWNGIQKSGLWIQPANLGWNCHQFHHEIIYIYT